MKTGAAGAGLRLWPFLVLFGVLIVLTTVALLLLPRPAGRTERAESPVDRAPAGIPADPAAGPARPAAPAASPPSSATIRIAPGETISEILEDQGFGRSEAEAFWREIRPFFDLKKIVAGRTLRFERDGSGAVRSVDYEVDDRRFLRVERLADRWLPGFMDYAFEVRPVLVCGIVEESVWAALEAAGQDPSLAGELESGVFGYDIDFWAGLRRGDAFRLIVERQIREGRDEGFGRILAAEFLNDGRLVQAFRFEYAAGGRNRGGFYHRDGGSIEKQFRKTPLLSYRRISSRFSASRFHPIRRVYAAHYGVDYAAEIGTPVYATAAGRVVEAGRNGGAGLMVRIKHARSYETAYLHLSRIDVAAGAQVESGQRIGAVGTSGESTGPHLDYRIKQAGRYLNPLSAKFEPVEPLPKEQMPAFGRAVEAYLLALDAPLRLAASGLK